MSDEIEKAIEAYRTQLQAEADIGRSDLAEIEDHLRELVAELRETGMPTGAAISEAARRLGDPRQLAREHARVRSAFGAKLSAARAWSAAILVTAQVVLSLTVYGSPSAPVFFVTTIVLPAIVALAMAARLTWARALILGMSGYALLDHAIYVVFLSGSIARGDLALSAAFTVISLGTFAFVMPWRRTEITQAGAALVVLFVAFAGATTSSAFVLAGPFRLVVVPQLALAATIVAGCGIVLRARWAAFAAAAATVLLVGCALQLGDLEFRFHNATAVKASLLWTVGLGALAAAVASVLSWRTARTRLGTLRSILT